MPKFDLYARSDEHRGRGRPWTPFRALIWTLLFLAMALWAISLVAG